MPSAIGNILLTAPLKAAMILGGPAEEKSLLSATEQALQYLKATEASESGVTVLGKFGQYDVLAKKLKANFLNIPDEVWGKLTDAEKWAINKKFLDDAIARGDKILLSHRVTDVTKETGSFRRELEYLFKKGYKLNDEGTALIPPPPSQ